MVKAKEITPGPYHVGLGAISLGVIEIGDDKNARRLCTLDGRDYIGRHAEMFGNANLFAAAPEMLDVLKKGLDEGWFIYGGPTRKLIQSVIAKAEGIQ